MKPWRVGIPIIITDDPEEPVGQEHGPPRHARIVYFRVTAETPDHAAQLLFERLEPYCGDP